MEFGLLNKKLKPYCPKDSTAFLYAVKNENKTKSDFLLLLIFLTIHSVYCIVYTIKAL